MCFLFVKIFCCYVYFVSKETRKHAVLGACEDNADKEWKFKEQHAKMWENIAGRKDTVAPDVPTPLESRGAKIMKGAVNK